MAACFVLIKYSIKQNMVGHPKVGSKPLSDYILSLPIDSMCIKHVRWAQTSFAPKVERLAAILATSRSGTTTPLS